MIVEGSEVQAFWVSYLLKTVIGVQKRFLHRYQQFFVDFNAENRFRVILTVFETKRTQNVNQKRKWN